MPTEHIVIVTFETTPENQATALEQIGAYVESFLSQQPGFIGSRLHRALDGKGLVHYARWTSEAAFQAAGVKARAHPDLPGLMVYKPAGRGFSVFKNYGIREQ